MKKTIITVIITAIVIGGAVYWWQQLITDSSTICEEGEIQSTIDSSTIYEEGEILDISSVSLELKHRNVHYLYLTSGNFPNSCYSIRTETEFEENLIRVKLIEIVKAPGFCSSFPSPAEEGIEMTNLEDGTYTLQIIKGNEKDDHTMIVRGGHAAELRQGTTNISRVKGWVDPDWTDL